MKIVQAVGWYFPTGSGGTEVYVSELSRRLRHAGHDVLIAAPDAAAHAERTYEHEGLQVYRYPIGSPATRAEAQGRVVARGAELFHAWLRRIRPDVVHMHTYVTGLGLAELKVAKALGARVVATTHSASLGYSCQRGTLMRWGTRLCSGRVSRPICAACQLQHGGVPRPLAYAGACIPASLGGLVRHVPGPVGTFLGMTELIAHNQRRQREMLELVDRFVVLTAWARDVLLQNGAPVEKISVNRLGVRFDAAAHSPHSGQPLTIAYIGRFDPIKGVEDLAKAIAAVPRHLPIQFEFFGPVRNRAELTVINRVKATVQGGPWVRFGAELDAEGVRAALSRIDVLCCPSRVVEGGPTVALEANAYGVPVVGTNLPALSEIVQDGVTGRLLPVGGWRELAATFRQLAENPAIVNRWREKLGAVRTMDDVTRDYLALYAA